MTGDPMTDILELDGLFEVADPTPEKVYVREGRRFRELGSEERVDVSSLTHELADLIEPVLDRIWRQTAEEPEAQPDTLLALGVLHHLLDYWEVR